MGFYIESIVGVKNAGVDTLSRPPSENKLKKGSNICGVTQVPEKMSIEALAQFVWDGYLKGH